jgi:hypothetical protein
MNTYPRFPVGFLPSDVEAVYHFASDFVWNLHGLFVRRFMRHHDRCFPWLDNTCVHHMHASPLLPMPVVGENARDYAVRCLQWEIMILPEMYHGINGVVVVPNNGPAAALEANLESDSDSSSSSSTGQSSDDATSDAASLPDGPDSPAPAPQDQDPDQDGAPDEFFPDDELDINPMPHLDQADLDHILQEGISPVFDHWVSCRERPNFPTCEHGLPFSPEEEEYPDFCQRIGYW